MTVQRTSWRLFLAATLAMLVGIGGGCPAEDWEPLEPTRGDEPRAQLGLKLKPGVSFTESTELQFAHEEHIGQEKMRQDQTLRFELRYQVRQVDDNGHLTLDVAFQRVAGRIRFDPTAESYAFDSAEPDRSDEALRPMLALIGPPLEMRIRGDGGIEQVDGLSTARQAVLDAGADLESKDRGLLEQVLDGLLEPQRLHRGMELIGYLPGEPVGVDARWARQEHRQRPIPLDIEYRFRLRSLREDRVRIDVEGRALSRGEPVEISDDVEIRAAVQGRSDGELVIDRATGLIRRARLKDQMEGDAFYPDPQGTSLTGRMVIEGETTVSMRLHEP